MNRKLQNDNWIEVHKDRLKSSFVSTQLRDNIHGTKVLDNDDFFAVVDVQKDVHVSVKFIIMIRILEVIVDINVEKWLFDVYFVDDPMSIDNGDS